MSKEDQNEMLSLADRVLLKNYRQPPMVLVRGQGVELWDIAGKRYLDMTAGISVCCLGHAHPALQRALAEQAGQLVHTSNLYFIELMSALGHADCLPPTFGLLTRVDTITPEGLEAMTSAGIGKLTVGLESGSEAVLQVMNKGITLETARRGLEMVRETPVDLSAFFIVGHPGDNQIESARTQAYIDRLLRDELTYWVDLSMFIPYPGTVFFANQARYGIEVLTMDWRQWSRNQRPISHLADFSANEIYLAYLRTLEVQSSYLRAQNDA